MSDHHIRSTCAECGVDRSHQAPGGREANPHAPTCSLRGGYIVGLTMVHPEAPGFAAQCDNGHSFWDWRPAGGTLEQQYAAVQANLALHNRDVHRKEPTDD